MAAVTTASSGPSASIGVIGGTGLYRFLEDAQAIALDTPYGPPSDTVTVATVAGRRVAFLPRHGSGHTIPPHRINYRANVWALHHLGVERIVAPCAVGSLRADRRPGEVVVCDQFVDRTHSREATFFDGPAVAHLSTADPYCPELRPLAVAALRQTGMVAHDGGTVVVVQGPRFSTRAESRHHATLGDVVNMTQCPEVVLARELGLCYVSLSLVTDYDCGVEGLPQVRPVTQEDVLAVLAENTDRLRQALVRLVATIPEQRTCGCAAARPSPLGHPG